ncbi:phospholipase/carboxylesterase [Cardiosporidium cionae]|uniref:Phospholipase/carboxylesterase n=1 Tax=Cardiosporidium cionae TaxID=476202 RepID=A0ABQ7J6Z4_9APIC|nr:phospholipase/carboxylesterase [Cardiosporidium cionae]|eukprot:KAF8819741.1 phospholipase/carboxylesterase [Cardiosporidium cionae]
MLYFLMVFLWLVLSLLLSACYEVVTVSRASTLSASKLPFKALPLPSWQRFLSKQSTNFSSNLEKINFSISKLDYSSITQESSVFYWPFNSPNKQPNWLLGTKSQPKLCAKQFSQADPLLLPCQSKKGSCFIFPVLLRSLIGGNSRVCVRYNYAKKNTRTKLQSNGLMLGNALKVNCLRWIPTCPGLSKSDKHSSSLYRGFFPFLLTTQNLQLFSSFNMAKIDDKNIPSLQMKVLKPTSFHRFTIVWMHGLGDTAQGWTFLASEFSKRPFHPYTKYIFPMAAIRPISINGGFPSNAWANIHGLSADSVEDVTGYEVSMKQIHNIVDKEIEESGIDPSNIIIGGFSQGAALSYLSALKYKVNLGGVVALSGWVPPHLLKDLEKNAITNSFPILHCHGDSDPLVPFGMSRQSVGRLQPHLKDSIKFKTQKGMGHECCQEELNFVALFLEKIFKNVS